MANTCPKIRIALYNNLKLLINNTEEFKNIYGIEIKEDSFDTINNNKVGYSILHYLINRIYKKLNKKLFKNIWPLKNKSQENELKKIFITLFEKCYQEFPKYQFPKLSPLSLVNVYGTRFCCLLLRITNAVLFKELSETDEYYSLPILIRDEKIYKKIFKKQSKLYFLSNTQKLIIVHYRITNEIQLTNELNEYHYTSKEYFNNTFTKYTQNINQLKQKILQLKNSTLLPFDYLQQQYDQYKDAYSMIEETSSVIKEDEIMRLINTFINSSSNIESIDKNVENKINHLPDILQLFCDKNKYYLKSFNEMSVDASKLCDDLNNIKEELKQYDDQITQIYSKCQFDWNLST